jgi:Family of unknown function (DUF6090)
MKTGKTSKYLKYAIGEIVLVVIGILIALQINNWNENRKNRVKELGLLKQLHIDFISNKTQLDSIKMSNVKSVNGCEKMISYFPLKREFASIDTVSKYFSEVFNVKTFNPSNSSIDALINSSSFEVIQNDTLRNLLVSWKDIYKDYSEEEQYARDLQIWEILPFLSKNIDYVNLYSERNLDFITTIEFQNLWINKMISHQEILSSIKDEKVEQYVIDIIRLTSNDD